jgi:hypothetical protein
MGNLFWGALIIAIGLFRHQSIFFGDFGVLNVIFDGLGLYWIGKGVLELLGRGKRTGGDPGAKPGPGPG